jgi:hypothetical protein
MDKLRVLLMPPRSNVSFLDGAMSSSMLRGDLEIECLHEELDGTSGDDDILLGTMFMAFFIAPCCTNSQTTLPGVSCQKKCTKKVYGRTRIVTNFWEFLEKEVRHGFFSEWVVRSLDYEHGSMNLQMNERLTGGKRMSGAAKRGQADRTRPADLGSPLPQLSSLFSHLLLAALCPRVLMLHKNPSAKLPRPLLCIE